MHFRVLKAGKPASAESILANDPDYILITSRLLKRFSSIEELRNHPSLSQTTAAQNDNIIAKDGMAMMGFGPRTIDCALEVSKIISTSRLEQNSFFTNQYIKSNQIFLIGSLLLLLIMSFLSGLTLGSYSVPILDIISGKLEPLQKTVLTQIRAPRVILAGFVGASLALSGASLQGLFRNPLADPGLIGVSAGAALGATSIIVLSNHFVPEFLAGPFLLPIAAILGAMLVIMLLFTLTKGFKSKGTTYMLLIGIAINSISGVCIGFLTYISSDAELRTLTFWTMGSFGSVSWPLLVPAIILISFSLCGPSLHQEISIYFSLAK